MQKHSLGNKTAHGAWALQKGIQSRQCTGQETYHVACTVSGYRVAVSWETKQQELTVDLIPPLSLQSVI